jgi:uncharacterized membrane protein
LGASAFAKAPAKEKMMANSIPLFEGTPNLSFNERAISVIAGLGLAAAAAKPRPNPLLNILALAGGVVLALRGATGHCPIKAALEGSGGQNWLSGGGSQGQIAGRA